MGRYSAQALDLSRFPPPLALRGFDYETILSERKERLVGLFYDRNIGYDVQNLETDPAIILQEADAYREMLKAEDINDSVRAVMIAFAVGSDLDHLAANNGVTRLVIGYEETGNKAPIYESDDEFRRRVILAPEAASMAGTKAGYMFHALTANSEVLNPDVLVPSAGTVRIALQSRTADGIASPELIQSVYNHLHKDEIKPLTDVVMVGSVTNHYYDIDLKVYVLRGPDPQMVKELVVESVLAECAKRKTPSRDVPMSAIIAAATVGPVDRVILASPMNDIAKGYGEVAVLSNLTVTVEYHDG